MRILHLMQCANLGGMEQSTLHRMRSLKARGHELQFISLNPLGQLGPLLTESDIPATGLEYKGRYGWRSFHRLRSLLRARGYDAVLMSGHNIMASLALSGVVCSKKLLFVHYHHFEGDRRDTVRWRIVYSVADRVFDHMFFCSEYIRQEALSLKPSLADKSTALANPFPLPPEPSAQTRVAARARLGLSPAAHVIGNAGWLVERKRFDVFLRVARHVCEVHPEAQIVIAGDGPLRASLEALALDLGLHRNIRFLGWLPNLEDFYLSLDVMLFNSDFDALGRTPVEAASYCVPIVASVLRGGLREAFPSEDDAMVLDQHDIPALARAILELLASPEARRMRGIRARQSVARYGDPSKHTDIIEDFLK